MPNSSAVLAIDIGTHAVRAAIVDDREVHHVCMEPLSLQSISQSHIEQDANELMQKTQAVIDAVLQNCSADTRPTQAALAIQRSSVVAWRDKSDEKRDGPILCSPILSWQDTRNTVLVDSLASHQNQVHRISGLVLSAHYGASKIRWLTEWVVAKGFSIQEYKVAPLVSFVLYNLLCDSPYLCDEANAGRTQLWDLHERRWSTKLCQLFQVGIDTLPRVLPICASYGRLRENPRIELSAVCGDQNAAYRSIQALVSENRQQPGAAVNIGSGAFLLSECKPEQRDKFLCSVYESDSSMQHLVFEGTVNNVGLAIDNIKEEWLAEQGLKRLRSSFKQVLNKEYKIESDRFYAQIESWWEQFKEVPLCLSFTGGLGSPYWAQLPKGISPYFPCDQSYSIEQKVLAVVESSIFLIAINVKALSQKIKTLYVTGGVAKIKGYCQMLADASRCTVMELAESESTLIGVSLFITRNTAFNKVVAEFKPRNNSGLEQRRKLFEQKITQLTSK